MGNVGSNRADRWRQLMALKIYAVVAQEMSKKFWEHPLGGALLRGILAASITLDVIAIFQHKKNYSTIVIGLSVLFSIFNLIASAWLIRAAYRVESTPSRSRKLR
jgi:mRNA-degrading endonuclease YafQ of YafQ-DinJ toxin-antitoxin module